MRSILVLVTLFLASACEQITTEPDRRKVSGTPKVTTVDSYFSPYSYGPVLRLYNYTDHQVILKIRIANNNAEMPLTATLYTFTLGTPQKAIDKWINNQHSDALYPDAAEPITTEDVSDRVTVTERIGKDLVTGRRGETYRRYSVVYNVDQLSAAGVAIGPFIDKAQVHVMQPGGN